MGDCKKGEKLYKGRAAMCHTIHEGGPNGVGPNLHGVIGRLSGSVEGFSYSQANSESGTTWTPEAMDLFLENPKKFMPGTKMAFAGLKKKADRENLITYLTSMSPNYSA